MPTILARLPRGARVVLVRLRSLGDCVLTTPAIRLLKQARPDLSIGIVVEPRFAAVFEGNPDVDAVLAPSSRAVRKFGALLCVNLHGGNTSARLTALSGSKYRAGFAHFRHQLVYNVRIPRAQAVLGTERVVHTAEHVASAMFYLGSARNEIPRAQLYAEAGMARAAYAVIHPVASEAAKTWPSAFFLSAAQHMRRELDLEPVFLAGPGEDLSPFQMWRTYSGIPLSETKTLIQGATLFLGNDSGPAHLAAAFGVPAVVLFGPSDPMVWAPWRTQSQVLVSDGPIHRISVQQVTVAMEKMRVHA